MARISSHVETDASATDASIRPSGRAKLRRLNGDLAGGFAATLVAVPQAMSLGILAYAALGPAYASAGVAASLLSSVIGNLVASATSVARCHIVGARASGTAVVASLVGALALHPSLQVGGAPDVPQVLAFVFLAIALAGLLQGAFAAAGLGRAIKFVPYPVVAGFMNGIAIIILLSQVRPALGLPGQMPLSTTLSEVGSFQGASLVTAAATLAAIVVAPRFTRRVPPMLCGLFMGVATHYGFSLLLGGIAGPVVGPLPSGLPLPREAADVVDGLMRADAMVLVQLILPFAFLLAAVSALDGLLAGVVADSVTRGRHDSNRLLAGQGLGIVLGAAFGALPPVTNAHTPIANFLAGGRTAFSTLFHAIFVLLVVFALAPLMAGVPVAALAGMMIYIAFTLMDRWTRELVLRLRSGEKDRVEIGVNIAIVLGVAAAQVMLNVMVAVAIGVSAAVTLLLVKLSGSPVRRRLDGAMRSSHKMRSAEAREALRPLAAGIQVLELEGELFFGTADQLLSEVDALPEHTRIVILDFRRVHEIDATGAHMLEVIAQRVARRDARVVLSHVRAGESRGNYLRALGLTRTVRLEHWFADLDRALEWAEDQVLERERFAEPVDELPLQRMALFANLTEGDLALLERSLERHELRGGDAVFLEGEEGDRLFMIAKGTVSIKLKLAGDERAKRLATYTAGVMFGEMALLEGQRRSADAFAKGDTVVLYSLSAVALEALVRDDPRLGLCIHRNIARELGARLRVTSGALRALE